MNQGIDYSGTGATYNRDAETGIRYGVISTHSLGEFALDDVEYNYGEPTCPKCGNPTAEYDEEKHDAYEQYRKHGCSDHACDDCQITLDSGDCYPDEPHGWSIDDGEYKVIDCLDTNATVIKSPYYTYAQFCSPCVPGACSLDSPLNSTDGVRCYCFGHDWFDDDIAPYPVFSVATGKQVISEKVNTPCPNCKGSGRDTVQRLASARQATQEFVRSQIDAGAINVRDFDGTDTFLCFRCDGKGMQTETVYREAQS